MTLVDFKTGECPDCKNKHHVTVKSGEWKYEDEKKYYGSSGNWYSFYKKASITVTVVYPKTYKNLCIAAGGLSMPQDMFWVKLPKGEGFSTASGYNSSADGFFDGDLTFKRTKSLYSTKDKKYATSCA